VLGKTLYSTSGLDWSCVDWTFHYIGGAPVLTAWGFIFEKIQTPTVKAVKGVVPPSWFAFTDYTCGLPIPPQKFWETVVAARGAKGEKSPRWYVNLIRVAYEENLKVSHFQATQLRSVTPRSRLMDEYQDRVNAVVWGRKMMQTDTTHRIGLAPDES
jgi:hypothetical protein